MWSTARVVIVEDSHWDNGVIYYMWYQADHVDAAEDRLICCEFNVNNSIQTEARGQEISGCLFSKLTLI